MAHNGLNEPSVHFTHRIELTRPRALPAALGTKPVKLVKSVGTFFTGNRSDGLFKTIEIMVGGESLNETGWRLVFTALERAIDQLFERADSDRDQLDMAIEQAFDLAQQRCGETINLDRIRIVPNFLDQPKSLALLKPAKKLLAALLQIYEMEKAQAASIADRLPTYFASALEFANAQHAGAAKAIFDLTKSPAAQAAIKENLWVKAHHDLGEKLNEGVLGDQFSLRQLYQPLRAYRAFKHDGGEVTRTVVDLETELDRWVAAANRNDAIRVICGGPGSGKSSFAKIWASRFDPLATRKTLLVPLHQPKGDNLEASIEWYCREICGFTQSAVDVNAGEPELLLLLDGLDELSMAGKTGLAAAHDLIDQVGRLIDARNTKSARLLVLIGGREILVQSLENRLRKVPIFHLMPYFHKDPAKQDHEQDRFTFADEFLARDQRHDW